MQAIRLFCLVKGEGTMRAFAIKINKNETISDLKKKIRLDQPRAFAKTDSKDLKLWMVNVRDDGQDEIRYNINQGCQLIRLIRETRLNAALAQQDS
ncbi:unnamed protein product [Rhizophagus irregularis]|uniref:Crinkler effector protein N-terminal domain-containing protein n=1 Tax=Rhizophagus irregularis TaxID=588596 RepID=A0A916EHK8_9GLOM|nr:unnamed protein product [Rhizophagus irregularis]CAB4473355.1 unnamed protein product [Rhizophagus irregularis]CAB5332706.1 unnamed protein product [Rhizophagus irregularis]CAB5388026.1 unnamed protein product [Rhizophagus irregularis]